MKSVTFVVPGPLTTRTGGSIYDRRVVEGLRARRWNVSVVELDAFAHPLAPPLATAPTQFAAIPDHELVLVDGLAFGTMPEVIERESWRLRFVPIVHMALSTTPGLTRGESAWLGNLERRALVHAHHIVITGTRTKRFVSLMIGRSADDQITRIPPGVEGVVSRPLGSDERSLVRLLCVANVTWGKGHDVLLEALAMRQDAEWELTCVGSTTRDPRYAERLSVSAAQRGLQGRIRWVGELDSNAIEAEFARADLFVLPTRAETYGMAVAEAIAHGLPVVSTRTGEIASIAGDGGLLVEPGDVDGLASALTRAIGDPTLRQQLADGARAAAKRLPTWSDTADATDSLLNRFVASPPSKQEGRIVLAPSKPEERRAESLSGWLALRQAADFAARSAPLTHLIASRLRHFHPIRILDLGTGTGSNIRYLAPKLDGPQEWLAVDQDPRLLAEVVEWSATLHPDVHVETRSMNLAELNASEIFERRHLVTASALLDLVSERWLRRMAGECRRVGACALFTINYNGGNECTPADPDDARVFALFNQHQLTDKGLGGPAAGPRAADVAQQCFEEAGFEVHVEPSDWQIGPEAGEFQRQLIEGWASAAAEMAAPERDLIDAWKQRRLAHVAAGRSQIVVGHHDLVALPR